MSKKKNTLKDLDEFLKQQAATLVPPSKLQEKLEAEPQKPSESDQPAGVSAPIQPTFESILKDLKALSSDEADFRKRFYELIIDITESQRESLPEDKMLINTALYLRNREHWKEAIREYWRNK